MFDFVLFDQFGCEKIVVRDAQPQVKKKVKQEEEEEDDVVNDDDDNNNCGDEDDCNFVNEEVKNEVDDSGGSGDEDDSDFVIEEDKNEVEEDDDEAKSKQKRNNSCKTDQHAKVKRQTHMEKHMLCANVILSLNYFHVTFF
nr:B3 domain-containing protein At5g60140-like [Ipomoea batatas]